MNEITQEICEDYVQRGLLNKNVSGDLTLYVYSKECFFGGHWDEVTKACRGLVFRNGEQINHPFPKIFNLDENPGVTFNGVMCMIENDVPYAICHKINGHLTIVDYIPELEKFIVHTKGSLQDNEMNSEDATMFFNQRLKMMQKVKALGDRFTFMFESVHETDPHTLYDQEVERYGKNKLVLLGGYYHDGKNWQSLPPFSLYSWSLLDNQPYAQFVNGERGSFLNYGSDSLNRETINAMFEEQNTEGYVIWFPTLDFRVKIKTTDYWAMRFRKELTADTIIDRFVSGGDHRLFNRYPEEIADKVVELVSYYFDVFVTKEYMINMPREAYKKTRKQIGLSDEYSKIQKSLLFTMFSKGGIRARDFMSNKTFRLAFKDFMDYNSGYKDEIKKSLIQFIEDRKV